VHRQPRPSARCAPGGDIQATSQKENLAGSLSCLAAREWWRRIEKAESRVDARQATTAAFPNDPGCRKRLANRNPPHDKDDFCSEIVLDFS